jgi:hypothetical protein
MRNAVGWWHRAASHASGHPRPGSTVVVPSLGETVHWMESLSMKSEDQSLASLLQAAAEAAPDRRIEFRDRIAAHGEAAIKSVSPWLADPALGAFAVRVIRKAVDADTLPVALACLRSAKTSAGSGGVTRDIEEAIKALRPPARRPQARTAI